MASSTIIHGTAVAIDGQAALMVGASGTGKSSLALQLIALGGAVVADDQVEVAAKGESIFVSRPDTLPELIEARGFGLLPVPMAGPARLAIIVDLDKQETARMPEERYCDMLGHPIKVIAKADAPHFPAAILLYLKSRSEAS